MEGLVQSNRSTEQGRTGRRDLHTELVENDMRGNFQPPHDATLRPRVVPRPSGKGFMRQATKRWNLYTLNLKYTTSASLITYSFPSSRNKPFSFTFASD